LKGKAGQQPDISLSKERVEYVLYPSLFENVELAFIVEADKGHMAEFNLTK